MEISLPQEAWQAVIAESEGMRSEFALLRTENAFIKAERDRLRAIIATLQDIITERRG